MKRFQTKPTFVEAIQWDELLTTKDELEREGVAISQFDTHADKPHWCGNLRVFINTGGSVAVNKFDWIVFENDEVVAVHRDDLFREMYEPSPNELAKACEALVADVDREPNSQYGFPSLEAARDALSRHLWVIKEAGK